MLEIIKFRPEAYRTLPTLAGDCLFGSLFGKFQAPEPFWFLKNPISEQQVEALLRRTTRLRGVAAIASLYDRGGLSEHFVVNKYNEIVQFRDGMEPQLAGTERQLRDMFLMLMPTKERHEQRVDESVKKDGKGIRLASSFGWCYWNPLDQWSSELELKSAKGLTYFLSDACYN